MLQAELLRRQERNPRYSLRAFAKFLEMHPSALSRVLNGKQDLSLEDCAFAIERLDLTADEVRLFIASVANDKKNRSAAILTRSVDPSLLSQIDFDPRTEVIVSADQHTHLGPDDVFALSADLISMMDLKGRFIYANDTVAKFLGTVPCELIGETWRDTALPEQIAHLLEDQQRQVVDQRREFIFDFDLLDRGQRRYFTRTVQPIVGANGEMNAFLSTIKDVTWDHFLFAATNEIFASIDLGTVLHKIPRIYSPALAPATIVELKDKDGQFNLRSAFSRNDSHEGEFLNALRSKQSLERLLGEANLAVPLVTLLENEGVVVGRITLYSETRHSESQLRLNRKLSVVAGRAIANALACL